MNLLYFKSVGFEGVGWTVSEMSLGQLQMWSDGFMRAHRRPKALDELSNLQILVNVFVSVDRPVLDVEAKVGRGIDASCRDGVEDHLELRPTGRVTGNAEELDGEDVGIHELCLSGDESVGFPDVSHAFAGHVVGGFDRHGDSGG